MEVEMNKIVILSGIIFCLIAVIPINIGATNGSWCSTRGGESGLTTHAPILIDGYYGYSQFSAANGVSNPNATGNESDPFIIEGWEINASGTNGIEIRDTDAHFIIQNCVVYNGYYGIRFNWRFSDMKNGKIHNVTVRNNYIGMELECGPHSISKCNIYNNSNCGLRFGPYPTNISECNVYNNVDGIQGSSVSGNISKCNVYNNQGTGIRTGGIYGANTSHKISACDVYNNGNGIWLASDNNQVTNCTVYNNSKYGIMLQQHTSKNNTITNCHARNNFWGIFFGWNCPNNILRNNTFENNTYQFSILGDDVSNFYQDIDSSNTINKKPIYYLVNKSDITFDETIDVGYLALISCSNIFVKNLTFTNNLPGLLVVNTSNCIISRCNIYNNVEGVYFKYSSNNIIYGCNIYDSNIYSAWHVGRGIWLHGSSNNSIIACNGYNNTVAGIGIELTGQSNNNSIRNCTIWKNKWPIELYSSQYNRIYHNNFIDNSNPAYGEYFGNYWDNGYPSGGNYWDDYNGTDLYSGVNQDQPRSDGIGDTPYSIPGWGNIDRYPLMAPANMTINLPPVADFDCSPTLPIIRDIIQFTERSYDIGGVVVSWFWDFGDGNTSTEQNPQHIYSLPSNYTVKLTVIDNDGLNATYTKLITIKEEEVVTDGGGEKEVQAFEGGERERFTFTYWVAVILTVIAETIIGVVFILKKRKKVEEKEKKVTPEIHRFKLRCPGCKEIFEIEAQKRPFKMKCPHCSKEGVIK